MSRVSTDVLVSSPPAEPPVGRSNTAPAADSPTFGDHLSRAAQPSRQAAKNDGVSKNESSPTQSMEAPPTETFATASDEAALAAAISVTDCGLLAPESAVSPVEADAASTDTDEDSNENPSVETISMIIALAATPASEPIVQVDTITLGEEAEGLAGDVVDEIPAANRPDATDLPPGDPSAKPSAVVRFSHVHAMVDAPQESVESKTAATSNGEVEESTQASVPIEGTATVEVPLAEFSSVQDTTEVIQTVAVASGAEKSTEKRPASAKTNRATAAVSSEAKPATAESDKENIETVEAVADEPGGPVVDRREASPKVREYGATVTPQYQATASASPAASAANAAATPRVDPGGASTNHSKSSDERAADLSLPALDAKSPSTATASPPITTTPVETPRSALIREGNSVAPLAGSMVGLRTAAPATNGSEVDRVRFAQRVARAVSSAIDRGGEVTLRLSPAELGSMRLEVAVREGVLTAHIETETSAARTALLDNLPALRDRLAEQNVRIEKFEVEVQGSATGSLPDRTSDQSNPSQREQAGRGNRKRTDSSTEITGPTTAAARVLRDGQLNVVV